MSDYCLSLFKNIAVLLLNAQTKEFEKHLLPLALAINYLILWTD